MKHKALQAWDVRARRGRAPEYLRTNPKVVDLVAALVPRVPTAVICHGAQLLAAVPGLLKGRAPCLQLCRPCVLLSNGAVPHITVFQLQSAVPVICRSLGETCMPAFMLWSVLALLQQCTCRAAELQWLQPLA